MDVDTGSADLEAASLVATEDDPDRSPPTEPVTGDRNPDLVRTVTAAASEPSAIPPGRLPPVNPARYHIVREFARGGLGRILEVRDLRLGRVVALKEILRDTEVSYARFVREALITARLQHPGIIPIHDLGRWPSGGPFYSMKLVSGRSLDEIIAATHDLDGRLALLPNVIAVADAIAYAHSQGIIHRDLKPANVLVGEFGETVVIDWGIAKDLRSAADSDPGLAPPAGASLSEPSLTAAGSVLGTPYYMSPEQASGDPVDERADVYALGALLYEVLTGEPPYRGARDPLAAVRAGPPVPAEEREPAIPPDLAAIARKAMASQPQDRYPSARELAEDLRRFQTGRLVSAHAYSRGTRVRRWLRRYRAPVIVAVVALTILAVTGAVSVARVVAERDVARAHANELVLSQASGALERDATEALTWLRTYPEDGKDWAQARTLALEAVSRGVARHVLHGFATFTADGRAWVSAQDGEHLDLHDAATGALTRQVPHRGRVESIAAAAGGRTLAVLDSSDTAVALIDIETGRSRRLPDHPAAIIGFALSPDGAWIASGSADGLVRLTPVAGGAGRVLPGQDRGLLGVAFSRDSRWVFSMASESAAARLWEVGGGATRAVIGPRDVRAGEVSPDGELVAFAHHDGAVSLWSTRTSELVMRPTGHTGKANQVVFSPDGRWIASIGDDRNIRVTAVATGAQHTLTGHKGAIAGIAFSPDNKLIATGGDDGEVRLWAVDGEEERLLGHHPGRVWELAFSPDGSRLATRISSGAWLDVRIWDVAMPTQRGLRQCHRDAVDRVAISSSGRRMATGSRDRRVCLWDTQTWKSQPLEGHESRVTAVAFAPDGARLASASEDGRVRLWDLAACAAVKIEDCKAASRVLPGRGGEVSMVAFSRDGKWLASADADATVQLWDTTTGEAQAKELIGHTGVVRRVEFAPDGRWLASAGEDRELRVWDLETGLARPLRGHDGGIRIVRSSQDGRSLWTASDDRTVRRWDVPTGQPLGSWPIGSSPAFALSPDDRWLAASRGEGRVFLVDPEARTERELGRHRAEIFRFEFSPGSAWLASAGRDQTVRLWDVEHATLEAVLQNEMEVLSTAFSPDGKWLAAVGRGAVVRIWPTPARGVVPANPAGLLTWMAALSTATLDARAPSR